MASAAPNGAGPSRPADAPRKQKLTHDDMTLDDAENDNPRAYPSGPSQTSARQGTAEEGEDEGDDERMDFGTIQSFADKIQYLPSSSGVSGATARINITIPKRGEKDFEPLQETVNLQEMMLQKSRQALFNALLGVRGGHSKSISHAILTTSHPYPRMLIVHGHMFDTMGITVRYPTPAEGKGKGKTYTELLPEEALYLLERGSLQIWLGSEAQTEEEEAEGLGQWCDEDYGVKGAVEMSVMEGFATFIGQQGLTWERYQAYAYLKRLGYTVHRSRRFIPRHFLAEPTTSSLDQQDAHLPPFRTWWASIPQWFGRCFKWLAGVARTMAGRISRVGLGVSWQRANTAGTLLEGWTGKTYASIFSHLRIVPAGHSQPLPSSVADNDWVSIYDPLATNPYLPFYHVWKPTANWSKRGWDKGSGQGPKPNYHIAAIEARTTPLPSIQQLAEIFDELPDEPKGPIKRHGPQYQRPPRPQQPKPTAKQQKSTCASLFATVGITWQSEATNKASPTVNVGALRNGDRGLVVAVNDSGNTGWVRFGRTGFAEMAPM